MATSDFKYCSNTDVLNVCPDIRNFHNRRPLRNWSYQQVRGLNDASTAQNIVDIFYTYDTGVGALDKVIIDDVPVADLTYGNLGNWMLSGGSTYTGSLEYVHNRLTETMNYTDTNEDFDVTAQEHGQATGYSGAQTFAKVGQEWMFIGVDSSAHDSIGYIRVQVENRGLFSTDIVTHPSVSAIDGATVQTPVYSVGNMTLTATAFQSPGNKFFFKDITSNSQGLIVLVVISNDDTDGTQNFFPEDNNIEIGTSWGDYIDDLIVNCSMELSSHLDTRFPRPIHKNFQYNNDLANETPEHDYILKRTTALLCAHHTISMSDPDDSKAQLYLEEAMSNIEKLNSGQIKLSFEIDKKDMSGDIIEMTRAGSMYLMETFTYEGWLGQKFDRVRLECTTTGVYGVAKIKFLTFGSDKLMGNEKIDIIVTGGLQHIGDGLYVRFEGNSMTSGDKWDIVIRNVTMKDTNSSIRSIKATRNPSVPKRSVFD